MNYDPTHRKLNALATRHREQRLGIIILFALVAISSAAVGFLLCALHFGNFSQ